MSYQKIDIHLATANLPGPDWSQTGAGLDQTWTKPDLDWTGPGPDLDRTGTKRGVNNLFNSLREWFCNILIIKMFGPKRGFNNSQ